MAMTGRGERSRRASTTVSLTGGESAPGGESALGRYGRYEVIQELAAAGPTTVYEARDPSLHRRVALKVLRVGERPDGGRAGEGGDGEAWAEREAQAMARLAHPNVVAVFETGRTGDDVWLAMELVAGATLDDWLRARPRRWREILEMYVAAGRGLAAAHAAGLVHRDFRASRVLIGRDGRPRISDLGMPAEPSDVRGDPLAFCVALWEALCGCGGRTAPRWLLAMLRRGLAVEQDARWPDLAALLDAIERRARAGRRWTLAAIAAATAITAGGAAAAVAAMRVAPDPCAPPDHRLAAVWSPARAEELRGHVIMVDPVRGASRSASITAALEAGARGWRDMHVAACRETRVEGSQSDTMLDRRMECLERWLVELGDTVDVVAQAPNPGAVDQALRAAISLSPLEACADAHALAAAPPPAAAEDRAIAVELANRTRELDVAQRAGRLEGLLARAVDLESAARALGDPPTLAAALGAEVRIMNRLNTRGATEAILRELVEVAARIHDDRAEANAWMDLFVMISHGKGRRDEALALVPSARAAVLRAGDPLDLRADLLYHHAIVLDYGSRPAEGLALLQQARALLEHAGAASPASALGQKLADVWYEIGTSYLKAEDPEHAIIALREAIEHSRAVNGVDSLDEAYSWQALSVVLQRAGNNDEALAAVHEAVRLREVRLGDSVALAAALTVEAGALDGAGRWDAAVAVYDRAIQMMRATMAPGDVTLGLALTNRGVALTHVHRMADAARDYDEAIALFERAGARTVNVAISILSRGDLAAQRDRCNEAHVDYARAIAMTEELAGPTFHVLIYPLTGEAACLVRTGKPAQALPLLERALRCKSNGADAFELALARAYLGRARVDSRRDVAGGLALARAARAEVAAAPEGVEELARLDRWLAAHTR